MIASSNTRRGITFLLLLVFFQQIGAGLFIHTLLHDKVPVGQTPFKQNESAKGINYACTCVDDFLMPFDDTVEPTCFQGASKPVIPVTFFDKHIPFHTPVFSSLRGPPVKLL